MMKYIPLSDYSKTWTELRKNLNLALEIWVFKINLPENLSDRFSALQVAYEEWPALNT